MKYLCKKKRKRWKYENCFNMTKVLIIVYMYFLGLDDVPIRDEMSWLGLPNMI